MVVFCIADGKDGHGLKFEKIGPTFSSFKDINEKSHHQNTTIVSAP